MGKKNDEIRKNKYNTKSSMYTHAQIDQMRAEAAAKAATDTLVVMLALAVKTISECFDEAEGSASEQKLTVKFAGAMFERWQAYNAGEISFDECKKVLLEEVGIEVKEVDR